MGLYKVTLKELYGCEKYLQTGVAEYVISHVSEKFRKKMYEEFNLTYNRRLNGYYVDEDALFEYFKKNYSNVLEKHNIKCYAELDYKAKLTLYRAGY